jgi:uncharacterized protein YcbX
MLTVSSLAVYPVKSCRGLSLQTAVLGRRGIEGDRNWMVVGESGRFLTQRELPSMALIEVRVSEDALRLTAPSMPEIEVSRRGRRDPIDVVVWAFEGRAEDEGEPAAEWLSRFLGRPCRLVRFSETVSRPVSDRYSPVGEVAFADAFPILVISQASLDALNARLETSVSMDRFRPNLVIEGSAPHAEDAWKRIRVGDVEIALVKPCDRCSVPAVDPATGVRGREPVRELATYRKRGGKIYFGQNGVHRTPGVLRVGDPVVVLE